MNSRAGLKRYGMRAYIIEGRRGALIIEREKPRLWFVRGIEWPRWTFCERFNLLREARAYCEEAVT